MLSNNIEIGGWGWPVNWIIIHENKKVDQSNMISRLFLPSIDPQVYICSTHLIEAPGGAALAGRLRVWRAIANTETSPLSQ